MKGAPLVVGFILLMVVGIGAATGIAWFIRGEPAEPLGLLDLPPPGEIHPDYLADGTPVWVARHEDGRVDVLSGFDTHKPSNLGKILWWCARSDALENPEHGSTYDEYGFKIGGPAPTGLPSYTTTVEGARVVVRELQAAPPPDAPHTGPDEVDRDRCFEPEHERLWHTFDGWSAWDSPTAAVQASPDGWILLDGHLSLRDGAIVLCAKDGCADSALAANVDATNAEREFGPLFGERFIAQVRDGALVGVTRVMPAELPTEP
jgi:hypothetical protein